MAQKQIQIRILKDGTIQGETKNIKGKQCEGYRKAIEELTGATMTTSTHTPEYYELDNTSSLAEEQSLFHGETHS